MVKSWSSPHSTATGTLQPAQQMLPKLLRQEPKQGGVPIQGVLRKQYQQQMVKEQQGLP